MVSRGHSGSVVLALSVGTCFLLSAVLSPQGKVLARGEGVGGGSSLGVWQSFLRSRQEAAGDGETSKG